MSRVPAKTLSLLVRASAPEAEIGAPDHLLMLSDHAVILETKRERRGPDFPGIMRARRELPAPFGATFEEVRGEPPPS